MKSVSGIVCYVKDIARTAEFYKILGFRFGKNEPDQVSVYLNWFWIEFRPQGKKVKLNNENTGLFVYIKVENTDDFYKGLLAKGLKPLSEPKSFPSGNREFCLPDPDGYKLVFFQKN